MNSQSSITIFTDGACKGNPGPGGWGCIIATPDGNIREMGGGAKDTTNNRMEMAAAIRALDALELKSPCPILLYTDSTYLIRGVTQWIWGWRARGWKTAEGKDVANRDLWQDILQAVTRLKPSTIEWRYVRGHSGYPGNERCDEIAVSFASGKNEPLYTGPGDGYFVDLTHLPEAEALPEGKKLGSERGKSESTGKGSAGNAVTYLSYRGDEVTRFKTWAECERHVKGQPNVKYKKAKSAQEEREILISWGLAPTTSIRNSGS
ncbi:MAG TPA: ribonuclease HI [Oculatellaceae cyanobacterium]